MGSTPELKPTHLTVKSETLGACKINLIEWDYDTSRLSRFYGAGRLLDTGVDRVDTRISVWFFHPPFRCHWRKAILGNRALEDCWCHGAARQPCRCQ